MVNVLAQKAMLAQLSISRWGARTFDKEVADTVLDQKKARKDVGLFTKRLLSKDALRDINRITNEAREYHKRVTQPWLDDGVRVLSVVKHLEYIQKMGEFRNEFHEALKKFTAGYPSFMEAAKVELGDLFDPNDYPPVQVIKNRYSFGWIIFPVPDAGDFRCNLDKDLASDIKAELHSTMEAQLQAAMGDTAERIKDIVGHIIERLRSYKPGDKKKGTKTEGKFHDSMMAHVRELADLIPAFNLTDDPKLDAIHKKIVADLCPVQADDLRDDAALRKKIAKDASDILKQVSTLMA